MSAFCEKRMLCKAQGYRGVMSVAVFETDPQFAGDSSFSHKLDYLDSFAPAIKFPFLLRLRIMFQRRRMTNETRWHLKASCCRSDTHPKGRHGSDRTQKRDHPVSPVAAWTSPQR